MVHTDLYNYRDHLSTDIHILTDEAKALRYRAEQLDARRDQLLKIRHRLNETIDSITAYERQQQEAGA